MDDWDLNCKPPPGLEVLGPKTEAQMKAESKRKMEREAADKERKAINQDFCSIYGHTKESAQARKAWEDDLMRKGIPLPPIVNGPGDPFKQVPPPPPPMS